MRPLIEQLFTPEQCVHLRSLWDDVDRSAIGQVVSRQLLSCTTVLNISNLIDVLMILCLTNSFAYSEKECLTVATLVAQSLRERDVLPQVSVDRGMTFSRKTLVALGLFFPAMQRRANRRGAPSPEFYRRVSQAELRRADYPEIADNHHRWEAFLSELLV